MPTITHKLVFAAAPGRTAVPELEIAGTPLTRMRGLLGRKEFPAGRGLLITHCDGIHMFFMRFAIDAVFLDGEMRVLKICRNLRPWRVAWRPGARAVLELPAGGADALRPGDLLALVPRDG